MRITRRGSTVTYLLLAAFAALLAAVGCEVIVPGTGDTPTCTMTPYTDPGNGTCPAGMFCDGAGCKACEAKDICDGFDNDCDGIIDDGPYSDRDGDGYTLCGKPDPTTGVPKDVDCNDDDPKIYPGGDEICNGKDDNCDGIIDNPNLVCPPNYTCVPQTGRCVENGGTNQDGGLLVCTPCSVSLTPGCCQSPNVCDPGTLACVPPGTQDAGATCSGNLACTTGICGDPAELGSGAPTGALAECTQPCCTSADCGTGAICWGGGTGGNYCVSATAAGRSAIGGGTPGASCSTGGDCRSGVCSGQTCEDTCCSDANCSGATTCAVATFAGNTTLACTIAGSTQPNQMCGSNADCASGFCANYCSDAVGDDCLQTISLCAQPCCSSNSCGMFEGNQFVCNDDYFPPLSVSTTTAPPPGTPVVPVCDYVQQLPPSGATPKGQVGDKCTTITECFSNLCTGTASTPGYCTDVCCVDSDCVTPGYVCRPTPTATGTNLRCVVNPNP